MIDKFKYKKHQVNGVSLFLLDVQSNLENISLDIIPNFQISNIQKYKLEFDRNKRFLARSFLYSYMYYKYQVTDFELSYNKYQKPFLKKIMV